jgi:hypothetical protein
VVLFAAERQQGLPLVPGLWAPDVRGLVAGAAALAGWAAAPADARPDYVVWMSFPNLRPSGRASDEPLAPPLGTRLAGIYEAIAVYAPPLGAVPHRTLAVRPIVTLFARTER